MKLRIEDYKVMFVDMPYYFCELFPWSKINYILFLNRFQNEDTEQLHLIYKFVLESKSCNVHV